MPPQVPPPTVALDLPRNNKLMRTIVEKMSKISKNIFLTANQGKTNYFSAFFSFCSLLYLFLAFLLSALLPL